MTNKLKFYNDSDVGYDNEWNDDELIDNKIEKQIEQDEEELKKV